MNLTRDKVMLQWYCAQRIKLDWNHCKVKVNKFWCYSLVWGFFSFSHDAYTFIFLVTSFFLHIFFNPPADTSAHVPEAPPSLLCGHQSYCAQLQSLLFASAHFTSEIEFSKLVHSKLHLYKQLPCRISICHMY